MIILIIFAIFAYMMPWVVTLTPLSMGAYDLAEWLSLYSGYPSLIPALLIRVQLVFLVYISVLSIRNSKYRLTLWVIPALLIVAQLPPVEFFLGAGDFNQAQQFTLATVSIVIAYLAYKFTLFRSVAVVVSLIAIVTAFGGYLISVEVLNLYGSYPIIGIGILLYILTWGCIGLTLFLEQRKQDRQ